MISIFRRLAEGLRGRRRTLVLLAALTFSFLPLATYAGGACACTGGGQRQYHTFFITAQHSGKALDVADASTANGARVVQWTPNGHDNQKWRLEQQPDGSYKITAKHSGKVLEVYEGSTADGAQVVQWDWHGGPNQRWWMEHSWDAARQMEYRRFINVHSGKVLDVAGGSTADGAAVHQWTPWAPWVHADHQKWVLTPVYADHF